MHRLAFGADEGPEIVNLVSNLFNDPSALPLYSYVALTGGEIVGHILFTRVTIDTNEDISSQILAPLAVSPDHQGIGVGTKLIARGLDDLAKAGVALVFVLGHPGYYPRAGFRPALELGLAAPYPIPEKNADAWMVQDLRGGLAGNVSGCVQCSDVLNEPQHWRE